MELYDAIFLQLSLGSLAQSSGLDLQEIRGKWCVLFIEILISLLLKNEGVTNLVSKYLKNDVWNFLSFEFKILGYFERKKGKVVEK